MTRTRDLSQLEISTPYRVLAIEELHKEREEGLISLRVFAKRHRVSKSTLYDWKEKYDKVQNDKINLFNESKGRQHLLDEKSYNNVI